MSFIRRDLAELTKQLQSSEPSPKHEKFMDRLLNCAEAQGKQVARVGYIEPPIYCIVDDDLQPVTPQPTEEHTMLPLTSSTRGLLLSLIASFGLVAYTEASSYGQPMQVEQPPQLIASTPSKPRRRTPTNGRTHKQNLRASKRNGKQYKVRRAA